MSSAVGRPTRTGSRRPVVRGGPAVVPRRAAGRGTRRRCWPAAARRSSAGRRAAPPPPGYGPLVDDPDGCSPFPEVSATGSLAQEGETLLDSGEPSPSDPDGSRGLPPPRWRRRGLLLCNHEVGGDEAYPVPHVEGLVYDPRRAAARPRSRSARDGDRLRHVVSLAGTHNNCAGGKTPWDTWLTCEETEDVRDRPHGYVFEVDPYDTAANRDPRPIKALGRFSHEAVAVDPDADVFYLTEDAVGPHGPLYRWVPPPGGAAAGPRSAAPAGRRRRRRWRRSARRRTTAGTCRDLSAATELGTTYRVGLGARARPRRRDDVGPPPVRGRPGHPRPQARGRMVGRRRGLRRLLLRAGRRRQRGASTTGRCGSSTRAPAPLTLQLRFGVAEDHGRRPDGPDNITVSPYGGVVIAENGEGTVHLLGATERRGLPPGPQRRGGRGAEFCGPVFSPDGRDCSPTCRGRATSSPSAGPSPSSSDRPPGQLPGLTALPRSCSASSAS